MNQTMNKLQINQLLINKNSLSSLQVEQQQNVPKTHRETRYNPDYFQSREGELSMVSSPASSNEDNVRQMHQSDNKNCLTDYNCGGVILNERNDRNPNFGDSSSSSNNLSNLTEEKDFTPGKRQFKTFLKSQTADRTKAVKGSGAKGAGTQIAQNQPTRKQFISSQIVRIADSINQKLKTNPQVGSEANQAQPRQQAKQESSCQLEDSNNEDIMKKPIKNNSYIGSNRMSPTPQPLPIEIFSQTESAYNNSSMGQQRDFQIVKQHDPSKMQQRQNCQEHYAPADDDPNAKLARNIEGSQTLPRDRGNSVEADRFNISPEDEADLIDENVQNLSNIFQKFNHVNHNSKRLKNSDMSQLRRTQEFNGVLLSSEEPTPPRVDNPQGLDSLAVRSLQILNQLNPFSSKQPEQQKKTLVRNETFKSSLLNGKEALEMEESEQQRIKLMFQSSGQRQIFKDNKGVSSHKQQSGQSEIIGINPNQRQFLIKEANNQLINKNYYILNQQFQQQQRKMGSDQSKQGLDPNDPHTAETVAGPVINLKSETITDDQASKLSQNYVNETNLRYYKARQQPHWQDASVK